MTKLRSHRYDSKPEAGGALTYPIAMISFGTGIMAFLVMYVVPQVATIFEQQQASLPLATKILIRVSKVVSAHWQVVTVLMFGLVGVISGALATPRGRRLYEYYDSRKEIGTVLEPVLTLAMAGAIVFMMLAVLMPIFQLNWLMK